MSSTSFFLQSGMQLASDDSVETGVVVAKEIKRGAGRWEPEPRFFIVVEADQTNLTGSAEYFLERSFDGVNFLRCRLLTATTASDPHSIEEVEFVPTRFIRVMAAVTGTPAAQVKVNLLSTAPITVADITP